MVTGLTPHGNRKHLHDIGRDVEELQEVIRHGASSTGISSISGGNYAGDTPPHVAPISGFFSMEPTEHVQCVAVSYTEGTDLSLRLENGGIIKSSLNNWQGILLFVVDNKVGNDNRKKFAVFQPNDPTNATFSDAAQNFTLVDNTGATISGWTATYITGSSNKFSDKVLALSSSSCVISNIQDGDPTIRDIYGHTTDGQIITVKPKKGATLTLETGGNIGIDNNVTIEDNEFLLLQLYKNHLVKVVLTGGGGSGAEAEATVTDENNGGSGDLGIIDELRLTKGGKGYTSAATVSFISDTGSGATATTTFGSGKINTITLTAVGSGYPTNSKFIPIKTGVGGGGSGNGNLHDSCDLASTANIDLSDSITDQSTIDGVGVGPTTRVLLKDQTTLSENGIYITVTPTDATTWIRATDFASGRTNVSGEQFPIQTGGTNGNTVWQITSNETTIVGTSSLVFAVIGSGAGGLNTNLSNMTSPTLPPVDLNMNSNNITNTRILTFDAGSTFSLAGGSSAGGFDIAVPTTYGIDFFVNSLIIPKFGITETSIESNVTLDMNGKNITSSVNPATDEFQIVFDGHLDSDTYISNSNAIADRINIFSNGINTFAWQPTICATYTDLDMQANALILDADQDTAIQSGTDDTMQLKTGGVVRLSLTNTELLSIVQINQFADIDMNNFNVTDVNAVWYDQTGTQSIYGTVGGIGFKVPTGDTMDFFVNDTFIPKFGITETSVESNINLNMNQQNITDVNAVHYDVGGNQSIYGTAGGIGFKVPLGDTMDFFVNNLITPKFGITEASVESNVPINVNSSAIYFDGVPKLASILYLSNTINYTMDHVSGAHDFYVDDLVIPKFGITTTSIEANEKLDMNLNFIEFDQITQASAVHTDSTKRYLFSDSNNSSHLTVRTDTGYIDLETIGGSDNLGNHIATQQLKMGAWGIENTTEIEFLNNPSNQLKITARDTATADGVFDRLEYDADNLGAHDFYVDRINTTIPRFGITETKLESNVNLNMNNNGIEETTIIGIEDTSANPRGSLSGGTGELIMSFTSGQQFTIKNLITEIANFNPNGFDISNHYVEFDAMGAPTHTTATKRYLFVDSTDNKLKIRTNIGLIDLESGGGADNLGNHTATEDLKMGSFNIDFSAVGQEIGSNTGGIEIRVPTSDDVQVLVNSVVEYTFGAGSVDITGNSISNSGNINFSTSGQSISTSGSGLLHQVPTGDTHDFYVNLASRFEVAETTTTVKNGFVTSGSSTSLSSTSTSITSATINIGDSGTDNINIIGQIDTSIIPDDNDSYNLGSATTGRWNDVYCNGLIYDSSHDIQMGTGGITMKVVGAGDTVAFSDGSGARITYDYSTDDFSPVDNIASLGKSGRRWVDVWAVNGTIQTSFTPFKKDITTVDTAHCLDVCNALTPIKYKWKPEHLVGMKPEKRTKELAITHMGFSADALKTMCPDSVAGNDGVYQGSIIGHLLGAIQELTKQIELLKQP